MSTKSREGGCGKGGCAKSSAKSKTYTRKTTGHATAIPKKIESICEKAGTRDAFYGRNH